MKNQDQTWQYVRTVKPRHGIAAPLDIKCDGRGRHERLEGQLYRFLPLPVKSGVPVHVNGSFILDSNRRDLWKCTNPDDQDDRSRWNDNLFKAISSSFADFFTHARSYYLKEDYTSWPQALNDLCRYYDNFPIVKADASKKKGIDALAHNVYQTLVEANAEILCILSSNSQAKSAKPITTVSWCPLISHMPATQVYFWSKTPGPELKIIHPILESLKMKITSASSKIMKNFNDILTKLEDEHEIPCISPQAVFMYYTEFSSFSSTGTMEDSLITDTAFTDVNTFLLFVKYLLGIDKPTDEKSGSHVTQIFPTDNTDTSPQEEHRFPKPPFSHFLLLSADGILRKFDEKQKIHNSEYSHLFPAHPDKFLHPALREINFHPSYFINCDDEDRERVFQLILEIFEGTFPQVMKSAKIIDKAFDVIGKEELVNYWKCFSENKVFRSYIPDFLKYWALLLTVDGRLFSTRSEILPILYIPEVSDSDLQKVHAAMMKLRMPFLDTTVVKGEVNCPTFSEHDRILSNIYHTNNVIPLTSILKNEEIDLVISYLSKSSKSKEFIDSVRCLPFFEDVTGKYLSIDEKKAHIWPQAACSVGYSKWLNGCNFIFVKECGRWKDLGSHEQFSIFFISAEQLYIQFIFPNFDKLDENECFKHLEHIRDTMFFTCMAYKEREICKFTENPVRCKIYDAQRFFNSLCTLKCIISPSGSILQPIHAYSDHTVEIFQVFSNELEFQVLPLQYQTDKWLEFFSKLGLKKTLEKKEYFDLCNKTADGRMRNTKECSDVLIKYIFSKEIVELWQYDGDFLRQVSEIPFVFSADISSVKWILPGVYSANPNQLVKLNGSASNNLRNLLWTVRPIVHLPQVCVKLVPSKEITSMLQTMNICTSKNNATKEDVMFNLSNICKRSPYSDENLFSNYPTTLVPSAPRTSASSVKLMSPTDLIDVIKDHLEFLDCHLSDLSVETLANLPCIPVHCDLCDKDRRKVVLVRPSCVVNTTSSEVETYHPFLHSLPTELSGTASNLLREIGIKHTLELHHMQIVLEKAFVRSEQLKLDCNTKICVKKAINKLTDLLPRRRDENDESTLVSSLSPLYLPNSEDVLQLSTSMLYGDTPSYLGHMHIDLSGTPYSHFDISEEHYGIDALDLCRSLPKQVCPLGMSENCKQVPVEDCEAKMISKLAEKLGALLQCKSNPLAIVKFIQKLVSKESNDSELVSLINKFLLSIKIITTESLKTDIMLIESDFFIGQAKTDYYLALSDSQNILYLDSSNETDDDILSEIAEHICKIARKNICPNLKSKLVSIIIRYLKAENPRQKEKCLEQYRIDLTLGDIENFTAKLGEEIPVCYHHRLDQDIHNLYKPMEYVGYEINEGEIIMAQIVHLVESEADGKPYRTYRIYTKADDLSGKIVNIFELYKFLVGHRKAKMSLVVPEDDNTALFPYNAENILMNLQASLLEDDLVEIKKVICRQLKEIWQLKSGLKRKAMRRSYLKWHPDKNLDDQIKAEKVFTFLKKQIENLDANKPLDDPTSDYQQPQTSPSNRSSRDFDYNFWNRTAARHRQTYANEQKRSSSSSYQFPFDSFVNKTDPVEGKRWVQQAEVDYRFLIDIYAKGTTTSRYGHVCFIAHQVAEKALKGAVYAVCGTDGRILVDHNLLRHANALHTAKPDQTEGLVDHSSPLESHYLDTRYPNRWPGCTSDHYTLEQAGEARDHARAVLDIVQSIMN